MSEASSEVLDLMENLNSTMYFSSTASEPPNIVPLLEVLLKLSKEDQTIFLRHFLATVKGTLHQSHMYYQSVETVMLRSEGSEAMVRYLWDMVAPTDPEISAYDEPECSARRAIFDYYIKTQQYKQGLDFFTRLPTLTTNESLTLNSWVYLRMTDFYILLDDIHNAEGYMNRAAVSGTTDSKGTTIQQLISGRDYSEVKIAYAKIMQAKQKFNEASIRFYQISQVNHVPALDQAKCLQEALVCAIVGEAGEKRSRLLASLFKDPRCVKLPLYPILEKAFFDRILKSDDRALCKKLIQYKDTIIDKAINEHNIMCVSKLYKNIQLDELAYLIGAEKKQAELLASQMIYDDRMHGKINQISDIIDFESRDNLEAFDKQIEVLLQATNNLVETIQSKYPTWSKRYKESST